MSKSPIPARPCLWRLSFSLYILFFSPISAKRNDPPILQKEEVDVAIYFFFQRGGHAKFDSSGVACLVLQILFLFVLSGILQECKVPVTVFASHFSSCEIHGLQGLGKVAMAEQTILKA